MREDNTLDDSKVGTTKSVARRILSHENAVLGIILAVLIAVLGVLTKGLTVSRLNIANVWLQSSMRGIAATGQAFVILTSGIDLSVGGVALITAVLAASMTTQGVQGRLFEVSASPYAGIAAMLFLGLGLGMVNGLSVARLRMPALIVTLAIWQMCRGGAYQMTRGWTILELPRTLAFIGQGEVAGVPVAIIVFVVVIALAYLVLSHTSYGRSIYAIGGNPSSAWLSGIKVPNLTMSVYAISGFLSALAGLIYLSRSMAGSMNTAAGLELDSIAAVVIGGVSLSGGRGNMIGVLLGVLTLGVINNGMNVYGLDPAMQNLVKGAIIFAAVAADIYRRR